MTKAQRPSRSWKPALTGTVLDHQIPLDKRLATLIVNPPALPVVSIMPDPRSEPVKFTVLPPPSAEAVAAATVSAQHPLMQSQLLDEAFKLIPDQQKLINIVSKRVRQLSQGHRPLVLTTPRMVYSDIALRELIDGKLGFRDAVANDDSMPDSGSA